MLAMGTPVKSTLLRPGVLLPIFVYERNESQAPRTSFLTRPKHEDEIPAESVHMASSGLVCELEAAVEVLPESACEPRHSSSKSVQVQLPTCHEASQANSMKNQSSISTQTESFAVSSGHFRVTSDSHEWATVVKDMCSLLA
ncbi:hypothetical protein MRX96_038460 [Rhipicephalus microplus]